MPDAVAARIAPLGARAEVVPGRGGAWWEQTALARAAARDRLDLFFAPAYTAPLACACPVVLTIHDLSYFARPEWFTWREGLRRRLLTRLSARRAALVLTDTGFSRSELESRLGLPAARIRVVPLGAGAPAPGDGHGPATGGHETAGGREPLVLFVGSIFNRRRVPDLVAAFRQVLADVPDARLEIIGENRTCPRQDLEALCRNSGAGSRIRLRSYVPDGELTDAFSRASAFAFLSEYEGFGLPPLEALARGVPPVLLDTPVAREVCGPAARYVLPGDVPAVAAALVDLLLRAPARAALLDRAGEVLARYSWPETARLTMAALESARA
jgi:glycosyltransferase involved in cell wall biosynthesis